MSFGTLLIAVLCPPVYCAIRHRWAACGLASPFWVLGVWLVVVGIPRWRWDAMFAIWGMLFWLFCVALALSDVWPRLTALKYVALILAIIVTILRLLQGVHLEARLAADHGTIAAMRSAAAIYYGQHNGEFPEHPGNYVNPSPPVFQCTNLTYVYSPTTGELKITSRNDPGDCL